MAKHTNAKHVQPKAALKFEKKAKKKAEAAEKAATKAAAKATKASAKSSKTTAKAAKSEKVAAKAGDSAGAAFASSEATAVLPTLDVMSAAGFSPATEVIAKKRRDKRKIARNIGIAILIVVVVVLGLYLGGVALFTTRFMPNTFISSVDLSLQTAAEVQENFNEKVSDYTVTVKGHGLNLSVTSQEAGLDIDEVAMTDAIAASQDPWRWPIQIFETHDVTQELTNALSATNLSGVVQAAVDEVNVTATDPIDAFIEFDGSAGLFTIAEEVMGTKLDFDAVLEEIVVASMSLEPLVVITDKDLLQPSVLASDPRLLAALDQANELIKADFTLMLSDIEAASVSSTDISVWVSITPEFEAVLDEAAMTTWAEELAAKFNTVGSTRTYTRPDGKTFTVSGGDYGWKVDVTSLTTSLTDAISTGLQGSLNVPVLQSGSGFSGIGSQDWGSRYIDVDLSEQHARFYDSDGTLIWESDFVSGAPTKDRATPQGVYDINQKGKNVTLIGSDTNNDGEPDYQTPVTFWMPFKGNSVGFHDATWQSAFGGERYRQGYGSHGCVNLPYSKAESLYSLIKIGDVVVVHS